MLNSQRNPEAMDRHDIKVRVLLEESCRSPATAKLPCFTPGTAVTFISLSTSAPQHIMKATPEIQPAALATPTTTELVPEGLHLRTLLVPTDFSESARKALD